MKDPVAKMIGQGIRRARGERRWSQEVLAKHLGVSRGAVGQWELGMTRPDRENEEKLIDLLNLPRAIFSQLSRNEDEPQKPSITGGSSATGAIGFASGSEVDTPHAIPAGFVRRRDLPVFGTAEGGADGMLIQYDAVEVMWRPDELENVRGGFALYVRGESMSPAYEPGDRVWVHPSKPPVPGDAVLIIKDSPSGHVAIIKKLVRQEPDHVVVRQYNPDKEFSISREEIISMHRVGGKTNR